MSHFLRSLGPAVARTSPSEAVRAGIGAFVGLVVTGALLLSPAIDTSLGLYLIAPFGASSVLLFAVPNSPLAQPWSAIVGNTVAALVGVAICMMIADPVARIALSVGLAITAMILCRAVHPPAGAVAMTAAMSPEVIEKLGFWFALAPVGVGTVMLVLLAAAYAKLTGRHYPLRQFDDPNRHGTKDPAPSERLGLSEEELTGILDRYRQSFNLGVEDLARLIGAAELQAASHRSPVTLASDVMSQDLVTVEPSTTLAQVAALFRRHRFTGLPVVEADGAFKGIIFQMHLIARAGQDAMHMNGGFRAALNNLSLRRNPARADVIMQTSLPTATPRTPISALLPMMADGDVDAVPILNGNRIVGIVTRTDLIAALARHSLTAS